MSLYMCNVELSIYFACYLLILCFGLLFCCCVALPILFYKLLILGLYLSVPLYIIMCKWFKHKMVHTLVMNGVKEQKRAVCIPEVRSSVWLLVGNKEDLPCCSATISIRWQVQSVGNSTMVRYKQKQKKHQMIKSNGAF